MASQNRIALILVVLLCAGWMARVGLAARGVRVTPGYTLGRIPQQLVGTAGINLPLQPFEVELLAPDGGAILQRRYGCGDQVFWLSAVQSQSDWRVQHPPQICYVAQGWRIEDERRLVLPQGSVRRMLVSQENERRVVYYFYTDGRRWTGSYFNRILHALLDRALCAQVSTWTMIQISTPWKIESDEARLVRAVAELCPVGG